MSDTETAGSALSPYPKIAAGGRIGGARVREWIALEKVHGAHFAVVCDAAGAHPAKRRELLSQDSAMDEFFGVSRIWPMLAVGAVRLASALRAGGGSGIDDEASATVTIYGELAGGRYPHPDVPAVAGLDPVQTGVWYAPDLRWLLFDAALETPQGRYWVSDSTLREAAEIAGLVCVPVLARGPLAKLQELPSAFPSKVSGLFGLPALEDNLAEGYVLKPAGEWRSGSDDAGPGERPLAKVKQKNFAEDERFEGSRPYLVPPEGAAGVPAWLLVQAAALLTPARAAAAVSKTGPRAPADTVALEITRDVLEELAAAVGGADDELLHGLELALLPAARSLARFDAADRAGD